MTQNRWRDIRNAIEQDIRDGILVTGEQLPIETELAQRYGAGRHSIRRAVGELAKEGLLSVQQGRGTFVQSRSRIEYPIGERTRLRANMSAQGIAVDEESLGSECLEAREGVAGRLGIAFGDPVIATRRLILADGVPVCFGTIYHDATRFGDFAQRSEAAGSVTAAYRLYGIQDYVRASTEMFSRPAREQEVQLLRQHPDMPVMVLRSIDATLDQRPLAYSEVVWSSARVKFSYAGGL